MILATGLLATLTQYNGECQEYIWTHSFMTSIMGMSRIYLDTFLYDQYNGNVKNIFGHIPL